MVARVSASQLIRSNLHQVWELLPTFKLIPQHMEATTSPHLTKEQQARMWMRKISTWTKGSQKETPILCPILLFLLIIMDIRKRLQPFQDLLSQRSNRTTSSRRFLSTHVQTSQHRSSRQKWPKCRATLKKAVVPRATLQKKPAGGPVQC